MDDGSARDEQGGFSKTRALGQEDERCALPQDKPVESMRSQSASYSLLIKQQCKID
jgi:hypothetical protein